ncbi:hypothetical protein GCM10008934_21010 [Virgibacillus salarius]
MYNSKHLFGTGEVTLIKLILYKIPPEGNLIVNHKEDYLLIEQIKEFFKSDERITFKMVREEK